MRRGRLWVVLLLLLIALFWIYEQFLPAFVEGLINRVVDNLKHAMVKASFIGITDIHVGSFSNPLETFEFLNF